MFIFRYRNLLSKKTPEEVIIQMKKHMLKLLSNNDTSSISKFDPKSNRVDVDISIMHQKYLEEHEPAIININGECMTMIVK